MAYLAFASMAGPIWLGDAATVGTPLPPSYALTADAALTVVPLLPMPMTSGETLSDRLVSQNQPPPARTRATIAKIARTVTQPIMTRLRSASTARAANLIAPRVACLAMRTILVVSLFSLPVAFAVPSRAALEATSAVATAALRPTRAVRATILREIDRHRRRKERITSPPPSSHPLSSCRPRVS